MGTFNSMISFTGKVGNLVGAKGEDGQTILRPRVKPRDPKTNAQISQRVKVSLAGQLSSLTPKSALFGMGSTNRKRRSNFLKNIIDNAVVTSVNNQLTAKLAPEKLVFSEGRGVAVSGFSGTITPGGSGQPNTVNITLSAMPNDVASLVVIAVGADATTETYTEVHVEALTASNLSASFSTEAERVNLYTIPVVQSDGASAVRYQHAVEDIQSTHDYGATAEILTSGIFDYAASDYYASLTTV